MKDQSQPSYRKIYLLLFILSFFFVNTSAQFQRDTSDITVGKLYLSPLPALSYSPTFGWIFGGAASAGIYFGAPSTTGMSNAMITATYSSKNQLMFTAKSNVYLADNKWFLLGDQRLFFSSQPTYGLGTGPIANSLSSSFEVDGDDEEIEEGELMEFNLIRLHQTALCQVKPSFFLGVGYHLDIHFKIKDQLLDLESDPQELTSHYTYSIKHGFNPEKYTTSGISANAVYDSRDNVATPYTGRFAFLSFRAIPKLLGSTKNATSLWLEYRDYFSLSADNPRNVFAVWTYGNFTTSGKLPYMNLPALGWDQMGKSGRAYTQGRFRGFDLCYAEAEWRFPLELIKRKPDLLGGVLFANVTTASNRDINEKLFEYFKPAAGVGLRVLIQKQSRAHLAIDYGWGADGSGALFLNMNEYF